MSPENSCTILLAKEKTWKRIFNANSELSQNRTEKQIMLFKTKVNWLFNDTWCYFVIIAFIVKLTFFNKQLLISPVRNMVYYILKGRHTQICNSLFWCANESVKRNFNKFLSISLYFLHLVALHRQKYILRLMYSHVTDILG